MTIGKNNMEKKLIKYKSNSVLILISGETPQYINRRQRIIGTLKIEQNTETDNN